MEKAAVLDRLSADDLARALLERLTPEEKIVWPKELYALLTELTPLPCVDAFPVHMTQSGEPEIGLIVRNTGLYKGRWWCIGGRVWYGESFGCALTRNVRETLGVGCTLMPGDQSWNRPVFVSQQGPTAVKLLRGEYWGDEPSKQCPSNTYAVRLKSEEFVFGSTAHGGREASTIGWFPLDMLPWNKLAYSGTATLQAVADWVRKNA